METKYLVRSLGLLAVCGVVFYALDTTNKGKAKQTASYAAESAAVEKMFNEWAYIAKEKAISKQETIKLLVIPSKTGSDEFFATKCLIYTNSETKTSSMVCPGDFNLDVPARDGVIEK